MINFEIKQVFSGNHSKIEIPLKHDKNREFSQEIKISGNQAKRGKSPTEIARVGKDVFF